MYYSGKHMGQSPVTVWKWCQLWCQLWCRDHYEGVRRFVLGIK